MKESENIHNVGNTENLLVKIDWHKPTLSDLNINKYTKNSLVGEHEDGGLTAHSAPGMSDHS